LPHNCNAPDKYDRQFYAYNQIGQTSTICLEKLSARLIYNGSKNEETMGILIEMNNTFDNQCLTPFLRRIQAVSPAGSELRVILFVLLVLLALDPRMQLRFISHLC
jgi:hypothetical protein